MLFVWNTFINGAMNRFFFNEIFKYFYESDLFFIKKNVVLMKVKLRYYKGKRMVLWMYLKNVMWFLCWIFGYRMNDVYTSICWRRWPSSGTPAARRGTSGCSTATCPAGTRTSTAPGSTRSCDGSASLGTCPARLHRTKWKKRAEIFFNSNTRWHQK